MKELPAATAIKCKHCFIDISEEVAELNNFLCNKCKEDLCNVISELENRKLIIEYHITKCREKLEE